MKKRLAVLLIVAVLLAAGGAVALGGSAGDPLVTLSYLTELFVPSLSEAMEKRANSDTKAVYDSALKELKTAGDAHVKAAQDAKGGFTALSPQKGEVLELTQGAVLLVRDGSYTLKSGALADVTAGDSVAAGKTLTAAHRYIATADAAVTQGSAKGSVGYQGEVAVKAGAPGEGDGPGEPSTLPFTDVPQGIWYRDAVAFCFEKNYFSGTAADKFSPGLPMNRAMLATVLYRLSGDKTAPEQSFSDVPTDQWFSAGVTWASKHKIVEGMGNGIYRPDMNVTREQIVTMLYRYQKTYRKGAAVPKGDLSAFPDGLSVSTWAQDAMRWAVSQGLIAGRDTGVIDPTGSATRAEVAVILQRFAQKILK